MVVIAFLLAGLLFLVTAAAVMLYVAFPHRGRTPRHARWLVDVVGRAADFVRSEGPQPNQGVLVDGQRDGAMRDRMRKVEKVVTGGITGR
jgi:hypothetical protein